MGVRTIFTTTMNPIATRILNKSVTGLEFPGSLSPARITFTAHGRPCLSVDSEYWTTWLSSGGRWRFPNARMCTNTWLAPEEGVIKPSPFSSLQCIIFPKACLVMPLGSAGPFAHIRPPWAKPHKIQILIQVPTVFNTCLANPSAIGIFPYAFFRVSFKA